MKVMILAGGLGSRLGEETGVRPKPMVEIGGRPILWHIMKIYSHYGFNDFIVLCGYKSEMIKEYFMDYYINNSDVTIDFKSNSIEFHEEAKEPWKVTLANTGYETLTGARIKKAQKYIGNEPFMLTYGDGLGDIDIQALIKAHKKSGKAATLTVSQPEGRFGIVEINPDKTIINFQEKPKHETAWVNCGFAVLEPEIFDYIPDENIAWEQEPLRNLAKDGKLNAYEHSGFWHPMDTLKEKNELNEMWDKNQAPWKIWEK